MTLVRTGLGFTTQLRTGLGFTRGRRVYNGDGDSTTSAVPLKWGLTPLASNAIAAVVTNTNISTYGRNLDGTLGAPISGGWGSATDAGLTPVDDGSNFVGIANAPAAGKRCWLNFSDTQDVEWILPGHALNPQTRTRQPLDRPFGLVVQGGRNHRMVGAQVGFSRNWAADFSGAQGQNVPAGSGYFAQWNRAFLIEHWTGVWDIVGLSIQPGNLYEAFNITNFKATPEFRLQRSRGDGIIWLNDGKGGHDGGDFIQTWHGPTGWFKTDHVTGISDFQGLFLAWNDVGTNQVPAGNAISYTNLRTVHPSGAWVFYNTKGGTDPVPPTTLDHVVVQDVTNPTRSMNGAVGSLVKTGNATPNVSPDGATADWTGVAGANTTGSIVRVANGATLPGGVDVDYAPASRVGFSYDPAWPGWAPDGVVVTGGGLTGTVGSTV